MAASSDFSVLHRPPINTLTTTVQLLQREPHFSLMNVSFLENTNNRERETSSDEKSLKPTMSVTAWDIQVLRPVLMDLYADYTVLMSGHIKMM